MIMHREILDDKRVLFLGEYNSLKNTIYWIKEDLYTRGQTTGS